jgi:biopolymer transport protein ExbD
MARKPSAASNRMKPLEGLNIAPLIDMVTCLMFFLLFFAAIIPVVILDAPLPKIASTAAEIKQANEDKNKLEIVVDVNETTINVKANGVAAKSFPRGADGKYPYVDYHKHMVALKKMRPTTTDVTLVPTDAVVYETFIEVMDYARELMPGDEGYQQLGPELQGKPEAMQYNRLFPEMSIGGV